MDTEIIVPSIISDQHKLIGLSFTERVREILASDLTMKSYQADDANWNGPKESAILEIPGKIRVEITLTMIK